MMERAPQHEAGILIVDDDEEDFLLAHELLDQAFPERESRRPPLWMKNGQEVLDFLRQRESSGSRPLLILLDLHLPKRDGMEVLEKILGRKEFKHVSVVAFTGLRDEQALDKIRALGVEVIAKPGSSRELQKARTQLRMAWSRALGEAV